MHTRHTNTDIRNYSKTEHELQSKGIEQMVQQDEVDVLDVLDQFKNESNDSRNFNNFFYSTQFTSAACRLPLNDQPFIHKVIPTLP